jgi:hypothetical protein
VPFAAAPREQICRPSRSRGSCSRERTRPPPCVMRGLDPRIHGLAGAAERRGCPDLRPGMTENEEEQMRRGATRRGAAEQIRRACPALEEQTCRGHFPSRMATFSGGTGAPAPGKAEQICRASARRLSDAEQMRRTSSRPGGTDMPLPSDTAERMRRILPLAEQMRRYRRPVAPEYPQFLRGTDTPRALWPAEQICRDLRPAPLPHRRGTNAPHLHRLEEQLRRAFRGQRNKYAASRPAPAEQTCRGTNLPPPTRPARNRGFMASGLDARNG